MKKIFVGNLSYDATETDVKEAFAPFGEVTEVFLPIDKFNNRPRGFAFVTMSDDAAATAAIEKVNGADMLGRKITVNEARPKEDRPEGERRSFGGGRGGDSRGGSGGRGFGGGRGDSRGGGRDRY